MNSVDIIIPIYNAFEDLELCLNSLYKFTDLKHNRLILINDNSSDERIIPFLNQQMKPNVIVIHNETNKGFSNNVNIGLSQSNVNDVILLNSDTILTANWVEKMMECAYSSETIGTVTPLSNNATLCSVPKLFQENKLPDGMDLDQAAAIVEQCSLKKYPQITVANGFCMLIKREVINLVGNFDAETFGRGYGEENDFCNRAEQMGYIHVMCDDTYIYHNGTKSFVSKEKEKYIEAHQKILYDRYPKQMYVNERHVAANPNRLIGENIGFFWSINNGKKNILYVLQSDFREGAENNVGGTQMHVKHLTEGLKENNNIFVAAINGRYLQVTAYIGNGEYRYRFFVGDKADYFRFRDRNFAKIFREIYIAFRIDLVHVHHLLTMSLDVIYVADKLNIPVIFTAHDFWCICPNISLRNSDGELCLSKENNHCKKCLAQNLKIYEKNTYIETWRREFHAALGLCKAVIVPSESTKKILCEYYPDLVDRIRVIYHGLDIEKQVRIPKRIEECIGISLGDWNVIIKNENLVLQGRIYFQDEKKVTKQIYIKIENKQDGDFWIPVLLDYSNAFVAYIPIWRLKQKTYSLTVCIIEKGEIVYKIKNLSGKLETSETFVDTFNVAFIGGISDLKGAKEIKKIIENADQNIRWYIIGDIGDADLLYYENEHLTKLGRYNQENLQLLLKAYKINAIGILSIWPETFSYTLSEALQMGIPVFVTDVGALGERINKLEVGKKISIENITKDALTCLNEWITNTDSYQSEIQKYKSIKLKTHMEMCEDYQKLYENFFDKMTKYDTFIYDKIFILNGMMTFSSGIEPVEECNKSEIDLKYMRDIQNSITWKIVTKLIRIRFPFKDRIYRYLNKTESGQK